MLHRRDHRSERLLARHARRYWVLARLLDDGQPRTDKLRSHLVRNMAVQLRLVRHGHYAESDERGEGNRPARYGGGVYAVVHAGAAVVGVYMSRRRVSVVSIVSQTSSSEEADPAHFIHQPSWSESRCRKRRPGAGCL